MYKDLTTRGGQRKIPKRILARHYLYQTRRKGSPPFPWSVPTLPTGDICVKWVSIQEKLKILLVITFNVCAEILTLQVPGRENTTKRTSRRDPGTSPTAKRVTSLPSGPSPKGRKSDGFLQSKKGRTLRLVYTT